MSVHQTNKDPAEVIHTGIFLCLRAIRSSYGCLSHFALLLVADDNFISRLHAWYSQSYQGPEAVYDGVLNLSYPLCAHKSYSQKAKWKVQRRQSEVNAHSSPSILSR